MAELLPVARAFRKAGNRVTALCGARSTAQIILDAELRTACDEVQWATDDGSAGMHGTVVDLMRAWKAAQTSPVGAAHVIGPIPMMRYASALTREWGVHTMASLNPIMVDGTGMCGGCRVTVGDKVKFACVDGPEFDAHKVDFEELTRRTRAYLDQERQIARSPRLPDRAGTVRLFGVGVAQFVVERITCISCMRHQYFYPYPFGLLLRLSPELTTKNRGPTGLRLLENGATLALPFSRS